MTVLLKNDNKKKNYYSFVFHSLIKKVYKSLVPLTIFIFSIKKNNMTLKKRTFFNILYYYMLLFFL